MTEACGQDMDVGTQAGPPPRPLQKAAGAQEQLQVEGDSGAESQPHLAPRGQGAGSGGEKAQDLRQPWSPLWRWGLAGRGVRWVVSLGLAGPVTWTALCPGVLPPCPARLAT